MSEKYAAISWNRQKKIYDAVIAFSVAVYLALFIAAGAFIAPNATAETLLIRGIGTCAFALLHVVLIIGPLSRFSPKFLPLLYNRRHLGVTTFFLGAVHGGFSVFQFHALGTLNPFVSLLTANTRFSSVPDFPFQILGLIALIIFFLMAATSHDFWLKNLDPLIWKSLHMLVYAAYALLVAHVSLGVLQAEKSPVLTALLALGVATVVGMHLAAALKERRVDTENPELHGFIDVCAVTEIPANRACIRTIGKERVAIFKYEGKISAISNVCRHQNGPLGEGRVIDGCVTCPWHGFQYQPDNGTAPPPFTEKVETFAVKVENGRVLVGAEPNPPGTYVEPARIAE